MNNWSKYSKNSIITAYKLHHIISMHKDVGKIFQNQKFETSIDNVMSCEL